MKLLTWVKSWWTNPIISKTEAQLRELIHVHKLRNAGLKFKKISKLSFFINNYEGNNYHIIFHSNDELNQYLYFPIPYHIRIVDL